MSYIRPLETDSLPQLNEIASARRIRALEDELASYRRGNTPRVTYLKYSEYENGGGSSTRRAVTEMQEQVRAFREELKKKDVMIQHLVSLESAPRVHQSSERLEVVYHGDKEALDRARSDVAALQVRNERLMQQIKDTEVEAEAKEIKIKELEAVLESKRENEAHLTELIQSLQNRITEQDGKLGSYETVSNRGEYTISTLQKDLRESNDKVLGLEAQIRELEEKQELMKVKVRHAEQKLIDFLSQVGGLLHISEESLDVSVCLESVMKKLTEQLEENALLKGKLETLSETLTSTQLEGKASRETIMRLASEMGREQKVALQYSTDIQKLQAEREEVQTVRLQLEQEVGTLREGLEASERLHQVTKSELQIRENRLAALEAEVRDRSQNVQHTSILLQTYREKLNAVLCSVFEAVDSDDEAMIEAVRKLTLDLREYKVKAEEYMSKVKRLTDQLDQQLNVHKDLAQRAKQYQTQAQDMECKLHTAEGELAAGDVLRESLKTDKEKYLQGLQSLGAAMKMDSVSVDLGLDMVLEALTARADQLVKLEADTLAERTSHMYNLKRRIKSLKDQLESKDLHIDLLRKKLTALEEKVHGRVELQKLAEAESLQVKKLEKLVARYKLQLTDARQEIQNLKAQLLGTTELKLHTLEQRKDVVELANQVEELETMRQQQATQITDLKGEAAMNESELREKLMVADNAVQALTSELRTTKFCMDDLKLKEKQLLEFRGVVSRMLGLDMTSLAIPDYEIITRLEKLIQAHHATALTTIGLREALVDVEDGFVSDFEIIDPVVRRSRIRSRCKAARASIRARSVSPVN